MCVCVELFLKNYDLYSCYNIMFQPMFRHVNSIDFDTCFFYCMGSSMFNALLIRKHVSKHVLGSQVDLETICFNNILKNVPIYYNDLFHVSICLSVCARCK